MSAAETITAAINFAALVFLGAQVMLGRRALKETSNAQQQEWDRQRRKASIEVSISIARYREELKEGLPWNDRDPKSVREFLKSTKGDQVKLASVRKYLNHVEDIAVGVKQGVSDLDTIEMLQGSRIVDTVANYAPYIESIRNELRRPGIDAYLEELDAMLKTYAQYAPTAPGDDVRADTAHRRALREPKRSWLFSWRKSPEHALIDHRAAIGGSTGDSHAEATMPLQVNEP